MTTSSKDKREGWLKELRAGDKVAVAKGFGVNGYYIYTISHITPGGKIVVHNIGGTGMTTFDAGGYYSTDKWHHQCLVRCTPEVEAAAAHAVLVSNVSMYLDFRHVSRDKLAGQSDAALKSLLRLLRQLKRDEA